MRKLWQKVVPRSVRQGLSDYRWLPRGQQELRQEIQALKIEIDELRRSQQRVAELMDLVEELTLKQRR